MHSHERLLVLYYILYTTTGSVSDQVGPSAFNKFDLI